MYLTFIDRLVQYANRRKQTLVSGTADVYDYERQEGTIFEEGTEINAANLNAMQTAIREDITGTILWTNGSPTSSFAGQTVTLSETIANFTKYEIEYALSITDNSICCTTGKIRINYKAWMGFSSMINLSRYVASVPSGTSIVFGDGGSVIISPYSVVTDNAKCIPLRIIGYK